MMTLSKHRNLTLNCLLEDMKGSKCCVIKVHQYIYENKLCFFRPNAANVIVLRETVKAKLSSFEAMYDLVARALYLMHQYFFEK